MLIRIGTIFAIALLIMVHNAWAVPLSPSVKDITSRFTVDTQRAFYLFADSHESNLIWYIPKTANIQAVDGLPQFSVNETLLTEGPFNGLPAVSFTGAFSTIYANPQLGALRLEASIKGLTLQPAQVIGAHTRVLLSGFQLDNQEQLRVECKEESWGSSAQQIVIPVCRALTLSGEWVIVDFVSAFNSSLATAGTIEQTLPFSGETLPGWEYIINDLLSTASSWDALMQMSIEWQLPTYNGQIDAQYSVNWRKLVDFIRLKIKHSDAWQLTWPQVDTLLHEAVKQAAGINIRYYAATGTSQTTPIDFLQSQRVKSQIIKRLRNTLFVPLSHEFLSHEEKLNVLEVPADIYLPAKLSLEQRWGSNIVTNSEQLEGLYEEMHSASTSACSSPEIFSFNSGCVDQMPQPIRVSPIHHREYYVLKPHYAWILGNRVHSFTLYHSDIEQISATTLLGIDCIEGAIGAPLKYANVPGCR
jgi:hypothetical protein